MSTTTRTPTAPWRSVRRPALEPIFPSERGAAIVGAALVAIRLVQERQWLPLALVVGVAVVYPFARPSLRAALAFVVGVTSLVGAVLTILDAHWNGFAADQLPGFALVAAGIALLTAAVIAVRGKPPVRGGRRVVRWILTPAATLLLTYYVVVAIGAALWITSKPRTALASFAVPHEDVSFRSADGIRLSGWYVPSRNGAAIVLVHGGGGDRDGLKLHATMLVRHGYGVLLYDERGRGQSGGRSDAFGWDWAGDVDSAVSFLEQHGVRHVGVLGLSTGAEVALTSAAEDHRIKAVVADGAEARTMDDFEHQSGLDKWTSLPYWGVTTAAVHLIRDTSPPPPLDELVGRIAPRPLLLIQSNDPAERALAPVWARIDGRRGVLWHVDAAHTKGLASHPVAYQDRVLGLFDRALLQ
jgi:uncharacterized protein